MNFAGSRRLLLIVESGLGCHAVSCAIKLPVLNSDHDFVAFMNSIIPEEMGEE